MEHLKKMSFLWLISHETGKYNITYVGIYEYEYVYCMYEYLIFI